MSLKRTLPSLIFYTCSFLIIASMLVAFWARKEYFALGPLQESKTVLYKKGMGASEFIDRLAEENVIRYPLHFKAITKLSNKAGKLKAGEYRFPAGIPVAQVIDMLVEGKVVIHRITIPEGLTVEQVVNVLNKKELLEGEIVLENIPEGSLLPETYHYTYGDSREEIILRMQKAMREVVKSLWPERQEGLPFTAPKDALVLASIVEKETNLDRERAKVAGVYINRLNKDMRLQADPTVNYGIYKRTGKLKKRLLYSDLLQQSPYNTYVNTGLPPTPIANPGRASIEAVLKPEKTDAIFFVADGKGGHVFAKTLKEHNRNVAAFRKVLNAD